MSHGIQFSLLDQLRTEKNLRSLSVRQRRKNRGNEVEIFGGMDTVGRNNGVIWEHLPKEKSVICLHAPICLLSRHGACLTLQSVRVKRHQVSGEASVPLRPGPVHQGEAQHGVLRAHQSRGHHQKDRWWFHLASNPFTG